MLLDWEQSSFLQYGVADGDFWWFLKKKNLEYTFSFILAICTAKHRKLVYWIMQNVTFSETIQNWLIIRWRQFVFNHECLHSPAIIIWWWLEPWSSSSPQPAWQKPTFVSAALSHNCFYFFLFNRKVALFQQEIVESEDQPAGSDTGNRSCQTIKTKKNM